jgi:hypothetical protein
MHLGEIASARWIDRESEYYCVVSIAIIFESIDAVLLYRYRHMQSECPEVWP